MLSIMDKLDEIAKNFRGWVTGIQNNYFLWVGLFVAGVAIVLLAIDYFGKKNN